MSYDPNKPRLPNGRWAKEGIKKTRPNPNVKHAAQKGVEDSVREDLNAAAVAAGVDPTGKTEGEVLDAILVSDRPQVGLRELFKSEGGRELLPEIAALDMDQGGKNLHKDNLAHTIQVVGQAPQRSRVRWAALLHDVGKPPTRKIEGRKVTFYNHEAVGERMSRDLLKRLDFEPSFAKDVGRLVSISGRTHGFSDDEWSDSAVRRFVREAGDLYEDALDLARADCTSKHAHKRKAVKESVDAFERRAAKIAAADEKKARRPVLNGQEIMDELGLAPGPEVGKARKFVMSLGTGENAPSREEALKALHAWAAERS